MGIAIHYGDALLASEYRSSAVVTIRADWTCFPPAVSYTHLRAHETRGNLVCRLLLEKKNRWTKKNVFGIFGSNFEKSARSQGNGFTGGKQVQSALIVTTALLRYSEASKASP